METMADKARADTAFETNAAWRERLAPITDPTKLYLALADCIDGETGRPTDLPKTTPATIVALLEDDDPNEDTQMRGMLAIARECIERLDEQRAALLKACRLAEVRLLSGNEIDTNIARHVTAAIAKAEGRS